MPSEVEDAAPVLPSLEDSNTACSLGKALDVPKGVRVAIKGRVVKVNTILMNLTGEPGLSSQVLSPQSNPRESKVADREMTFS